MAQRRSEKQPPTLLQDGNVGVGIIPRLRRSPDRRRGLWQFRPATPRRKAASRTASSRYRLARRSTFSVTLLPESRIIPTGSRRKRRVLLVSTAVSRNAMVRKFSALLTLVALLASPAAGFDTYWHSQCSQKVGEQFGFTEDAWKVMQLGDFSPDFFGPVSEYASKSLKGKELEALNQSEANNPQVRGAAIFLHFDNLSGDFQRNSDFDYLFTHLLQNTRSLLAGYSKLKLDERTRKVL